MIDSTTLRALAALLLLCACDSRDPVDAGTPRDSGGGADAGSVTGVPHDFVVLEREAPVSGATAYVDVDGVRTAYTSGSDGTFTAMVDWAADVAVTIDAADRDLISYLLTEEYAARLSLDGGPTELRIFANPPSTTVTISGTITGIDDPTHNFNVVAQAPGATVYNDVGPDWEIEVPAGETFPVTALEFTATRTSRVELTQTFHRVAVTELGPFSADTTDVAIDLSTSLPFSTADGTVSIPDSLSDGTGAYGLVQFDRFGGLLGSWTASAPQAADATTLDFTVTWWEPPGVEDVIRQYFIQSGELGSVVNRRGYPTGGATPTFLDPPTILAPEFGVPHPLHDPIAFGAVDATVAPGLFIQLDDEDETTVWVVFGSDGERTITVPAVPEGREGIFPSGVGVFARPRLCELLPGETGLCQRVSFGTRIFDLQP